jgi:hypothetical protein
MVAKALHTYVRTYSLFKSRHLSTNIKLTLYKALIVSYDLCLSHLGVGRGRSTLEIAVPADQSTPCYENLDRCISVCELHVSFIISNVYDYITKCAAHRQK